MSHTAQPSNAESPQATIHSAHAPPISASLSRRSDKRALFGADSYFRDGWEDACGSLDAAELDSFVSTYATILVKPDAVAARRAKATIDWLADYGATIVAAERCRLTPHVIRALWQYQWNLATRDRRDLADLLMPATESLLIVVRAPVVGDVPFTVTLSEAKGPADPRGRRPGQLRYALGNENYLLNFVHTTDEPADMVRELAILLDPSTRTSVYRAIRAGVDVQSAARREVEILYRQTPVQDLRLSPAIDSLADRARRAPRSRARDALLRHLEDVRSGSSRDWRALCELAEQIQASVGRWPTIVLGTHLMSAAEDGREPILAGVKPHDWTDARPLTVTAGS